MMLCFECKRLWPRGTAYCGSCGGSLGRRYCPQGHESPLHVRACLSCGSTKLSKGARAVNSRLLVGALVALLVFASIKLAAPITLHDVHRIMRMFLYSIVVPLVSIYIATLLFGSFLGDRLKKAISNFWKWLFRCSVKLMSLMWRGVVAGSKPDGNKKS